MNSNNLDKLSIQAKEFVKYFTSKPQILKTITATSDYCISDPLEFNHIKNVIALLDEIKENGNISSYQSEKVNGNKVVFVFN